MFYSSIRNKAVSIIGKGKRGERMPEDGFTYFQAKMDLEALDEKLKRFIMLRNELVMLAKEIGLEVSSGLLELKVK